MYALTLPIALVWTEKYVTRMAEESRQKAIELTGEEAANHYFVCILMELSDTWPSDRLYPKFYPRDP